MKKIKFILALCSLLIGSTVHAQLDTCDLKLESVFPRDTVIVLEYLDTFDIFM